jgi:hypothetical protein
MRGLVIARPGDPSQPIYQLSQTYAHATFSVTLLGPMPASQARSNKFQRPRRLSLLLRASEAAIAHTEISTNAPDCGKPLGVTAPAD